MAGLKKGGGRGDAARRAKVTRDRGSPLKDVIVERPRILLVGINPGLRSGATGHHFAGRGNPFWRLVHAAGLVPELLTPEEDQRLASYGIALTELEVNPQK